VEGYYAAKNAYEIAKKLNIECAYINATYSILYELANPKKTIMDLANKLY
jgi:glycerol-3-phosphate dehydrogenase